MNEVHPDVPPTSESGQYWFKVVGFLQQNWALVCATPDAAIVWFVDDRSGVFDRMDFPTAATARDGLARNGFRPFVDGSETARFIAPPSPPFRASVHPQGRIYSEGTFWLS